MKKFAKYFALMAVSLLLFAACTREEENEQPQTPGTVAGFYWKENDMNGPEKKGEIAEFRNQYKSLFVLQKVGTGTVTVFEINLTDVKPGTYTFGGGNALYYNGFSCTTAVTGQLIITANANGKASGTFEASCTGTGVTKVFGSFTDIPSI